MPIKKIVCLTFGPNPSVLVRGYAREAIAHQQGIRWQTIQLEPYLGSFVPRRFKSHLLVRKLLRAIGKLLSTFLFIAAVPRILRADFIYVIKSPPLWMSRVIKFLPITAVLDFDDPIWIDTMNGKKWFEKTMANYDGFTCDNEIVLEEVQDMCKLPGSVIVGQLLSAAASEFAEKFKSEKINNQITLGWVGSFSTFPYMQEIKNPLVTILTKYPQVKIVILGLTQNQIRLLDLPVGQVRLIENYDEFEMVRQLSQIDIGLFPLDSLELSYLRGTHKVNMYSRFGIPTVATKTRGIERSLTHGFNGFVCESEADWVNNLSYLIENPDLLIEAKSNAAEFDREYQQKLTIAVPQLLLFSETLK